MGLQSSNSFQIYCGEISKLPLLTRKEEVELSAGLKQGGAAKKNAINIFINGNLRLVVKIAQGYKGMGLDVEDLINEGNIGLQEAAKRYDADKGAKFSSYASLWIKQSMRRALSNKSRTIRVPTSAYEKFQKISKYIENCKRRKNKEPTRKEIARRFSTSCSRVESILKAMEGVKSLDALLGEEASRGIYEVIPDATCAAPDVSARLSDDIRVIDDVLSTLTKRERLIVCQRFGFDGGKKKTLEAIGESIGITRERVRQIQSEALKKMKWQIKDRL
tara:strand:- start:33 stop:860 length:828 start_codon:yes stop_codon:yes gene_type:complete